MDNKIIDDINLDNNEQSRYYNNIYPDFLDFEKIIFTNIQTEKIKNSDILWYGASNTDTCDIKPYINRLNGLINIYIIIHNSLQNYFDRINGTKNIPLSYNPIILSNYKIGSAQYDEIVSIIDKKHESVKKNIINILELTKYIKSIDIKDIKQIEDEMLLQIARGDVVHYNREKDPETEEFERQIERQLIQRGILVGGSLNKSLFKMREIEDKLRFISGNYSRINMVFPQSSEYNNIDTYTEAISKLKSDIENKEKVTFDYPKIDGKITTANSAYYDLSHANSRLDTLDLLAEIKEVMGDPETEYALLDEKLAQLKLFATNHSEKLEEIKLVKIIYEKTVGLTDINYTVDDFSIRERDMDFINIMNAKLMTNNAELEELLKEKKLLEDNTGKINKYIADYSSLTASTTTFNDLLGLIANDTIIMGGVKIENPLKKICNARRPVCTVLEIGKYTTMNIYDLMTNINRLFIRAFFSIFSGIECATLPVKTQVFCKSAKEIKEIVSDNKILSENVDRYIKNMNINEEKDKIIKELISVKSEFSIIKNLAGKVSPTDVLNFIKLYVDFLQIVLEYDTKKSDREKKQILYNELKIYNHNRDFTDPNEIIGGISGRISAIEEKIAIINKETDEIKVDLLAKLELYDETKGKIIKAEDLVKAKYSITTENLQTKLLELNTAYMQIYSYVNLFNTIVVDNKIAITNTTIKNSVLETKWYKMMSGGNLDDFNKNNINLEKIYKIRDKITTIALEIEKIKNSSGEFILEYKLYLEYCIQLILDTFYNITVMNECINNSFTSGCIIDKEKIEAMKKNINSYLLSGKSSLRLTANRCLNLIAFLEKIIGINKEIIVDNSKKSFRDLIICIHFANIMT